MRKLVVGLLMLTFASTVFAQSPGNFWLKVITACGAGPNDKSLAFLGTTNTEGPGSVWNLNHGPVLMAKAIDYFGSSQAVTNAMSAPSSPSPCDSSKLPNINVGVDAPINVSSIGNAEANVSFKSAKSVAVTAASVTLESMPTLALRDAINKLQHNSVYFYGIVDGRSYALVNAYAVQGLQITYTLTKALTGTAKASIQASPTVSVGTAASPVTASVSVSDDGTKVVVTVPDKHYVLGQMFAIGELSAKQTADATSKVYLGKKVIFTNCMVAAMCGS